MADVPGFISPFTSVTKSSPIPTEADTAVPAPPTMAPMVAPTSGAPSTRPARNPTTLQDVGRGRERLSVERERSIGVPHDHCDVIEYEVMLVPPQADDFVTDLIGPSHVVVPNGP